MKRINNRIVVDLNKVSYAYLHWCADSFGCKHISHTKPYNYTVNGAEFDSNEIRNHLVSKETMLDYALRRNLIDHWYPRLTLQLSNNHSLVYVGDKALELWKAWQAKVFGKKGKK